MTAARPGGDTSSLARLLAGGRHNRLVIIGGPPPGLEIGATAHFERVVRLVRPGEAVLPGGCVADSLRLPFTEALFDRLLVTSLLPAGTARAELRELWRIMSPAALALLVIKARRPWRRGAPGWLEDDLRPVLDDAMFEVLEWEVETIPDRHHLILAGKRDGLRAAPIGAVPAAEGLAMA
jgi:hypothetical protein